VAAGLVFAAPATATPEGCGGHRDIQLALDELTGTHGLPGAAIQVSGPGGCRWVGTSGVANLATGEPMMPRPRFRIVSVTKSFTATVVLQLAAERRLRLDAPVERYLPGVIRGNGYDGRKITVRQLLVHTSGLPDHFDALDWTNIDSWRFRTVAPAELIDMALSLPRPENRWHYSTTNYVLAGLVVERITGKDIETEVTDRIIEPLRLTRTYWPGDSLGIRGPHPRGYEGRIDFTEFAMTWGGAGGALISTMTDVNTFFRALWSGRLLPPAWLAEMRRTVPADPDRLWPGARYGLGLISSPLSCGGRWWGHGGTTLGFRAVGAVGPDGRQVSMVINHAPPTAETEAAYHHTIETALCAKH
jgi:D-alanyl-D-alanine carboxypeptidase